MLHGVAVDHMIEGGPAHKSNQLEPGDLVLKVDGKDVTEDTLPGMVIGSDMPGSIVTLTVQKASHEVRLRRGYVREHIFALAANRLTRDRKTATQQRFASSLLPNVIPSADCAMSRARKT